MNKPTYPPIKYTRWTAFGSEMRLYPGSLKIETRGKSKRFKIDAEFFCALTSAIEAIEKGSETKKYALSDLLALWKDTRGYAVGEEKIYFIFADLKDLKELCEKAR